MKTVKEDATLGASRVTAERGGQGGQRAVDQWMQSHPISHAPDIIIRDYDGPNSFVLIDIKTLDAAGSAHIGAHHTDRARLTAHLAIAANSRRHQYGDIALGLGTDFCWTRAKFLETISSLRPSNFPGNFREICYHR